MSWLIKGCRALIAVSCFIVMPLSWAEEIVDPTRLTENSIIAFFTKRGEVVKEKSKSVFYRKLMEKRADGSYLVQDFYSGSDKPQTTPIVLLETVDLMSWDPRIDGFITWYDDTGAKSSSCLFKAGKRNGYCSDWYKNGQLANQYHYHNGILDGLSSDWYESGIKRQEIRYQQGKKQGLAIRWTADGDFYIKGRYVADEKEGLWIEKYRGRESQMTFSHGHLNGPFSQWYANGLAKEQGTYQLSKPKGLWQYWNEQGRLTQQVSYGEQSEKLTEKLFYGNGQVEQLKHYKKGKLEKIEQWYENGQIKQLANYKEGKLEGKQSYWFANGQLMLEATYKAGQPLGSYRYWYESGQLKEQGSFKNNVFEGSYIAFYENGKTRIKGRYSQGNYQGIWSTWHDNGQQASITHYNKQGERDGLYRVWDKTAKPVKQAVYKNGLMVTDVASCALPLLEGKAASNIVCYFNRTGQIVEEKSASRYYRKVIKQNNDKSLVVADFYTTSNAKYMDPITLKTPYAISSFTLVSAEGAFTSWHDNGAMWKKGQYKNGQLDGVLTVWSPTGKKTEQISYKKGVLNGLSTYWDYAGKMVEEKYYKEAKLDGLYRKYRDGVLAEEGSYKNDLMEGKWTYWSWQGYKEREIHYVKNEREGLAKKWNQEGHLIWRGSYKDGYLQWEKESFSLKGL